MKTIKINSIILTNDGGLIVTTAPSESNKSGAYKFNAAMAKSLARNAGCGSLQQLVLMQRGATLSFDEKAVKAGETWVNTKTGETGTYTKDHVRVTNTRINLSEENANKMLLISGEAKLDIAFLFGGRTVAAATPITVPTEAAAPADSAAAPAEVEVEVAAEVTTSEPV